MTDFFSRLSAPTPSYPSSMSHFFRSSASGRNSSGRDSPRTMVAEEMLKMHIGTPPLQPERTKAFTLAIPPSKLKKRSPAREVADQNTISSAQDPLFRITPPKRRSPRRVSTAFLSPLEEMDISEDPPSPSPHLSRPHSPPPEIASDSDEEMDDELCPPDERTRYVRQKKRAEQVSAYRMRELKDDRESRVARRNNPLSPKSAKVSKVCLKRVKFAV